MEGNITQRLAVVETKIDDLRASHLRLISEIGRVLGEYHKMDVCVAKLDTRVKVLFGGSGLIGIAAIVLGLLY